MRVLIIRNYPSYMSVKNNTYNIQEVGLAKALVRRGHTCDILFWTNKEEETYELSVIGSKNQSIKIYYKRGKTALKNTVYLDCERLFDSYDILQPCEYNQIEAWYLSKRYPSKTVIYHGPYYSPFNRRYNLMCKVFDSIFLRTYKRNNTQFIVKSNLAAEFLKGKGLSNIDVVGVGIDAEMLNTDKEKCNMPLFNNLKRNTQDYKFLYIGKFEERRNIPFLLDIYKKICGYIPYSTLYMIGTGEKEYIENTWRYAKKIGIFDRIVYQEGIEQKYLSEIYKRIDCFILPTEYEIFGMVLLEAMYYRNLVVTTNNGGSSTLIHDGENGLIIESKDPSVWAEKIVNCLKDMDLKESMVSRASKTISESFTWDKLASLFEKSYLKRIAT